MVRSILERPEVSFPELPRMTIPRNPHLADTFYERIEKYVSEFQADLKPDEEVGLQLVNAPGHGALVVTDIGFHNPSMIIMTGETAAGERWTLLVHMTQVNLLLVAKKVAPGKTPRRIGFSHDHPAADGAPDEG